jgi:hypothetical protein
MPLNTVIGFGTMHDTTPNNFEGMMFQHWISSFDPPFDPEKTLEDLEDEAEARRDLRFHPGTEAEFISELRHQLAVLTLRSQSDLSDLRSSFQSQVRRINSLEAMVPQFRLQQHQLSEVAKEVRAMKRTITDLQCDVESQKRSVLGRINAIFDRVCRRLLFDR